MATSTSNFDFSGFSVDVFYFWNLKIKTFAKFLVPLYKNSIFFSQYKWQQSKNKKKKLQKTPVLLLTCRSVWWYLENLSWNGTGYEKLRTSALV